MKRVLVLFCIFLQAAAQNVITLKSPIALDKLPSGDMFALTLEGQGQVYRLQEISNQISAPISSFKLPTWQAPSDIVSAIVNGQQTILVAGRGLKGGFIAKFSDTGQLGSTWRSPHALAGLDYDFNKNTIYVASSDTPEIYQTSVYGGEIKYCGAVVGARQLGPVIFDSTRNQLLIGEVRNGELYSLNLTTHRSHLVTSQLGSPQALLLSSDNRTLFIADALQRKIYRLDLSNANAVPAVFSADRVFQEPVGLARLSSGAIVVADDRANALFVLSPQGKVVGK